MTHVITGASGHLGNNLVRRLLKIGVSVRAVVNRSTTSLEDLNDLEIVSADVTDPKQVLRALSGASVVYHLAGKISIQGDPDGQVEKTNVLGTQNVAEACRAHRVDRLIHVSSVHAFDYQLDRHPTAPLDESFPLVAQSSSAAAYDRSKAEGERRLHAAIAEGLPATIVNPTGVLGPFDFAPSRLGQVFLDLKNKKMPSLVPGSFNFVDVRDVVSGMLAASTRGQLGENYLLAGHDVSVRTLADYAESVTGVAAPKLTCPMWLARGAAPLIENFARITKNEPLYTRESLDTLRRGRKVSWEKAGRELHFSPRPLIESVRDTYASFEELGIST